MIYMIYTIYLIYTIYMIYLILFLFIFNSPILPLSYAQLRLEMNWATVRLLCCVYCAAFRHAASGGLLMNKK